MTEQQTHTDHEQEDVQCDPQTSSLEILAECALNDSYHSPLHPLVVTTSSLNSLQDRGDGLKNVSRKSHRHDDLTEEMSSHQLQPR